VLPRSLHVPRGLDSNRVPWAHGMPTMPCALWVNDMRKQQSVYHTVTCDLGNSRDVIYEDDLACIFDHFQLPNARELAILFLGISGIGIDWEFRAPGKPEPRNECPNADFCSGHPATY